MKMMFASICILFAISGQAQTTATKPVSLPINLYKVMRDSTTAMDIIFMGGKGGSISLDGKNVLYFNSFFENKAATKTSAPQAGYIMWQIDGREFISGNFYLGDSTGYVVFNKDGKEYVNLINTTGTGFFKQQMK